MPKETFEIVTEVGAFAGLNIKNPTSKEVEGEDKDLDQLILESTQQNKQNLQGR